MSIDGVWTKSCCSQSWPRHMTMTKCRFCMQGGCTSRMFASSNLHACWGTGVATDSKYFDVFGPHMWWSWRKYGIFRCLDQQIFVTANSHQKWTARLQVTYFVTKISQGILAFMWHYPKAGFGGIWWTCCSIHENLIDPYRTLHSLKLTSQFHQLRWKSAMNIGHLDFSVASLEVQAVFIGLSNASSQASGGSPLSDVVHDDSRSMGLGNPSNS